MKIVLLGAPGCGKSTLCPVLHEKYHICHLAPTDLLQEAVLARNTAIAQDAQALLDVGGTNNMHVAARDDLVMHLAVDAIKHRTDCAKGFVLDGLPRTVEQADILEKASISPDAVLVLDTPREVVLRRLAGRWVHRASRRIYHDVYCPPKVSGKDDITGEPLEQRPEDQRDAVTERILAYETDVARVRAYYSGVAPPHPTTSVVGAAPKDASDPTAAASSTLTAPQQQQQPAPPLPPRRLKALPKLHVLTMGDTPLHDVYESLSNILNPIYTEQRTRHNTKHWWQYLFGLSNNNNTTMANK